MPQNNFVFPSLVMRGLDPRIHDLGSNALKSWVPAFAGTTVEEAEGALKIILGSNRASPHMMTRGEEVRPGFFLTFWEK